MMGLTVMGSEHSASGDQELQARTDLIEAILCHVAVLTDAEKTALCVELHRQMAEKEEPRSTVVVQATAVLKGSNAARAELVIVESGQPGLVAASVVQLARAASPELWAEIRAALAVAEAAQASYGPAAR